VEAARVSAVILYSEGNNPRRVDLFFGTVIEPAIGIPVLSPSFTVGEELVNNIQDGVTTAQALGAEVAAASPRGRSDMVATR
jgi:hypothetical protein